MSNHHPDESIESIDVVVHTADIADAGASSDVSIELFDRPPGFPSWVRVSVLLDDADIDCFESGVTATYALPAWYFKGRVVNDITVVRLFKDKDSTWGGWARGSIRVLVNGKELYSCHAPSGRQLTTWPQDDGEVWTAPDFPHVVFPGPAAGSPGLEDAGRDALRDKEHHVVLRAKGGKKLLTWKFKSSSKGAFRYAQAGPHDAGRQRGAAHGAHRPLRPDAAPESATEVKDPDAPPRSSGRLVLAAGGLAGRRHAAGDPPFRS